MTDTDTIIVTRHPSLVEYAREIGLCEPTTPVLAHVTPDDVRGKHVIGVLPLHLAALAARVTEIPLALTPADRGRELDLARVREIAQDPRSYVILDGQDWDAGVGQETRILEDIGTRCLPYHRPSKIMKGEIRL